MQTRKRRAYPDKLASAEGTSWIALKGSRVLHNTARPVGPSHMTTMKCNYIQICEPRSGELTSGKLASAEGTSWIALKAAT